MLRTCVESMTLLWIFTFICLPCEPGERMINQFGMFENRLLECNWYLLSIKMQPMYMIFVSVTQNPIKVCSYAGIACERNTSKMVFNIKRSQTDLNLNEAYFSFVFQIVNKAFSYFMMIRNFRT